MLLTLLPMVLGLVPVGHFDQPVYVTSPPKARHTLIVVERYGRIREVVRGRVKRKPYVDLRKRVLVADPNEEVDQRGLFSVAFPPDYRRSRRFYVDYVDRSGRQRIDELRRGSRRVRHVLDLGPVSTQHHGGQLQFGPDGLLYASTGTGDGTRPGTIIRFDPRRPRPEVYATGLRNPWRFSFHRGALLIGDVGDHAWEEVDVVPRGAAPGTDFGWPAVEGPGGRGSSRRSPTATPTAGARSPAATCCAAATSTATSAPGQSAAPASMARRSPTTARSAAVSPTSSPSGVTRAGASTRSASAARSTA